jgi:hypothetical protein
VSARVSAHHRECGSDVANPLDQPPAFPRALPLGGLQTCADLFCGSGRPSRGRWYLEDWCRPQQEPRCLDYGQTVAALFAPPALDGLKWLVVPLGVTAIPASLLTFALGLGRGPEGLPSYFEGR